MLTAYSAVNTSAIPADARIIFAYANPPFAQIEEVRASHPHARVVPIVTHLGYMGEMYDFEKGAIEPNQAGFALHTALSKGIRHPISYSSRSDYPVVRASALEHHIGRSLYRVVLAIGTDPWEYPPEADGVQALRTVNGQDVNVYHLAGDFFHWHYDRTRHPIHG